MTAMAGEPHVAGRPGSRSVAEYALRAVQVLGPRRADRDLRSADAVADRAASSRWSRRRGHAMAIKEPVLAEDPDSNDADSTPVFNAYSADGDVDRRSRLRQLRHAGRLRAPEADGRRRQGQDRDCPLRRRLARHQAEGRLRARRHRLPHLLRSARRRLLRRAMSIPAGAFRPEQGVQRGSVMDMPIHPGRSADARAGRRSRAAASWTRRGGDDPEDPGAADLLRRRAAAAEGAEGPGRAARNGAARCR